MFETFEYSKSSSIESILNIYHLYEISSLLTVTHRPLCENPRLYILLCGGFTLVYLKEYIIRVNTMNLLFVFWCIALIQRFSLHWLCNTLWSVFAHSYTV